MSEETGVETVGSVATGAAAAGAVGKPELAQVIEALKGVYDPEIPVDIYELGLIYDLDVKDDGRVDIKMTLTAPGCPVAGTMPGMVEEAVTRVAGVTDVSVELVWDPPWDPSRMSEAAKLELNMF
jgi:FeS assembly SUF system protein